MSWINAPKTTPKKYIGFCYQVTELKTGKKYIGIKKFWTPKGKETNWRKYNTSSGKLKDCDLNNKKKYRKEITHLCESVTEMKATEAWIQLDHYMKGQWDQLFNEMINLRLRIRK